MSAKSPLKFHPFVMLRTPYFSHQDFDVSKTQELLKDPIFQSAIYLATPAFYQVLKTANFDWDLLSEKAKLSLHKYHNRMCFRPTPFGLCAAFGQTAWQSVNTNIHFNSAKDKLHLQFDHQVNCALANHLTTGTEELIVWKNPSLHLVGQQFRYVKTNKKTGAKFDFTLAAIAADVILKAILKKIGKTGIGKKIIVHEINKLALCTPEEAADYLAFLITEEILLSDLGPTLIGTPFLKHRIHHPISQNLDKGLIKAINSPSTLTASALEEHFNTVKKLLPSENLNDLKTPYYANLERNFVGGISNNHQQSILKAIAALQKLIPNSSPPNWNHFIERFRQRYEQQKVPLLKVLDPEIGLGYGQQGQMQTESLLEDLPFASSQTTTSVIWDEPKQMLLKKWLSQKKNNHSTTIQLHKVDLEALATQNTEQLAPSLFVMFRLLDDQVFIENAGGVSATALAGRFTLFNQEIWQQCRDMALQEQAQQAEVIFADLIQHSAFHTDNINLRQSIYDYEIPINGISKLLAQQQIPLSDLTLRLMGNELILESISLKRRVIPRLTTAFNAQLNELSVFRFLFDLQSQGLQTNLTLNLEQAFPGLDFYPRVNFENTILCLAKWKLLAADIENIISANRQHPKEAVTLLKTQFHLPDVVAITRHDHQLVFNISIEAELERFISCLQGLKSIWVVEFPFASTEKAVVRDQANKPFIGQFIAHLMHQNRTYSTPSLRQKDPVAIKRTFIPGDDWLYLKLYIHPNAANRLLGNEIFALIKALKQQNEEIIWFFIRYNDPEPHIRLRIHQTGVEDLDLTKICFIKLDKLVQRGFIHSIQTDSYQRELERYQIYGIDEIEFLFCNSSQLILLFLNKQQKHPDIFVIHHFALYSVSVMIKVFIPKYHLQLEFLAQMFTQFYQEFSNDKLLSVALDQKYRNQKVEIAKVLEHKNYPHARRMGKPFEDFLTALKAQKERNKDLSHLQIKSLLADLIHMHLNRLFQEDQRKQEMIIYHFLAKYQKSQMAKNKVH